MVLKLEVITFDMVNICKGPHYFHGFKSFMHPWWLFGISSINSTGSSKVLVGG